MLILPGHIFLAQGDYYLPRRLLVEGDGERGRQQALTPFTEETVKKIMGRTSQ
jgi:hypothetical protein